MPNTKTAADYKDEIIQLYRDGMSANKIGNRFNFQAATVLRLLRKEGVEIRTQKFVELNQEQLEKEYATGTSSRDLAKKYDCSHETILKRLRGKVKITKRNALQRMRAYAEVVVKDYMDNLLSIHAIARKYKCAPNIVRRILEENNVTFREKEGKYLYLDENGIIQQYENGWTSPELAKQYDCSEGKILSVLKNNNVSIRKRGVRPKKTEIQ